MNICKKSRSNFSLFLELFRFEFFIWDKCDVTVVPVLHRGTFKYWKLQKRRTHNFLNNWVGSIKFYISNIFGTRNSKMDIIFGFLVPKMLEMSNFIDPTQLFQKLRVLLFCNFQYLKVPLCKTGTRMTSHLSQIQNSNLNNSRNNENFDLLFFADIHNFWWSIRFQQKIGDNFLTGVPL